MIVQFIEPEKIKDLYPLTLTRPAADLRCGILTIAEKWAIDLHIKRNQWGFITQHHLQTKGSPYTAALSNNHPNTLLIAGNILPNPALILAVQNLSFSEVLVQNNTFIAALVSSEIDAIDATKITHNLNGFTPIEFTDSLDGIFRPYHIFKLNGKEIAQDFERITSGRSSMPLSISNRTTGEYPIFIEEGAKVEFASLNSNEGPIYIGKNAEIMEGCLVRGPVALCEGSVLKMGSKVYTATTLGPFCVAGGEISNVVFWGYSNKGHDGFLGNSVLGEWCNIGADTNASNLKNTYDEVKVWNYSTEKFEKSGQQFCGLIMGDHSKCGINTMFNTGTVVGVACNLFGAGFPRQFIPDFSWGGAGGFITHKLDAVHKTASLVMPRRNREYTNFNQSVMEAIFETTTNLRGKD